MITPDDIELIDRIMHEEHLKLSRKEKLTDKHKFDALPKALIQRLIKMHLNEAKNDKT
jgi:hypothetical protein